jgi:TatD DNase family protein
MLIDSHCHLNYPEFADISAVIARAKAADVQIMQTISTKRADFAVVKRLAEVHPEIYCSIGIHPHEAEPHEDITLEELLEEAAHPRVIGIGETGLDFYYEHSPRVAQEVLFRRHIEAGRRLNKPVIVHSRDADEDTIRILHEEHERGAFPFLIHCFSSTKALAEESIKLGGYISLSGILTFKKSNELRDIVEALPLERLLVETDAPYLAPLPHRGKPNEPAWTVLVAEQLAEVKRVSVEEVHQVTTENFIKLFNIKQ